MKEECAEHFTVGGLRVGFEMKIKWKVKDQKTCIFLALHFDLSWRIWSHNFQKRNFHMHSIHKRSVRRRNVILFKYFLLFSPHLNAIYSQRKLFRKCVLTFLVRRVSFCVNRKLLKQLKSTLEERLMVWSFVNPPVTMASIKCIRMSQ